MGTIVYGVIEIRRQTRAKELTPEEHARVARLTKGIREGRETLDEMAIELSKEEIKAQEALLLKAKTESERQKYIRNIEILKKNLVPLEQRL